MVIGRIKLWLALLAFMGIFLNSFSQEISIKVKGSDTCLPLTQKMAEEFIKRNPGASIVVTGGGSGVGISSLRNGTTDIAQSTRKIKLSELISLKEEKVEIVETIIARDALALIVNPSNKVSRLTREEIEAIYTGRITNWKDVGGDDMNIVVYSRETSSGTYEFFREHVMNKKNYAASALLMPATGAVIQSVSQTLGAIGYVGLAYIEPGVKALSISYDHGNTYIEPSLASSMEDQYPICRLLYFYYPLTSENRVKPFIDFILSRDGQMIVGQVGFIPTR